MLLPIYPSDQERFRQIEYRRVSLTNLFGSIRSGLPVTQETPRRVQVVSPLENGLRPVVFLRLQSIRRLTSRIDWQVVRRDLSEEPGQSSDAKPLPVEELLQEDDYLLTMRGKPYGMGLAALYDKMPADLGVLGLRLAAGNNFIRLRPNPEADCEPSFLHLLLDMLVLKLRERYHRIRATNPTLESMAEPDDPLDMGADDDEARLKGSFIRVSDLRAMSINIPVRREDREWLKREYQALLGAQREAWRNLQAYRDGFRAHIIPLLEN